MNFGDIPFWPRQRSRNLRSLAGKSRSCDVDMLTKRIGLCQRGSMSVKRLRVSSPSTAARSPMPLPQQAVPCSGVTLNSGGKLSPKSEALSKATKQAP